MTLWLVFRRSLVESQPKQMKLELSEVSNVCFGGEYGTCLIGFVTKRNPLVVMLLAAEASPSLFRTAAVGCQDLLLPQDLGLML